MSRSGVSFEGNGILGISLTAETQRTRRSAEILWVHLSVLCVSAVSGAPEQEKGFGTVQSKRECPVSGGKTALRNVET